MKRLLLLLTLLSLSLAWQASYAQTRILSGNVKDDKGQPIIGATVEVKGTTVGTVTDVDGDYSLAVPKSATTLEIKYVGLKTQEIALGTENVVNVSMQSDVLGLDEVVVTALGIEEQKKNLGTATQQVGGDQLVNSGEANALEGLAAKSAGVQVQASSGSPGASTRIVIRGFRSITGNNQPLIVVDGIPIDNSLGVVPIGGNAGGGTGQGGVDNSNRAVDLNPSDIASINILKGPAASALYGSAGSNGVLIVTTKKGQAGITRVNFTSTYSFDNNDRYIDEQNVYLQGSGGVFLPALDPTGGGQNRSWGARDDTLKLIDGSRVPIYDNQHEFYITGNTASNNLNISGGNDRFTYFTSLGAWNQTGIIPNTKLNKYSFLIKGDDRVSSWMKISASANYIKTYQLASQKGSNVSGVELGLLRTPINFDDANRHDSLAGYFGPSQYPNLLGPTANNYRNADGSERKYGPVFDNPYWTAFQNPYTSNVNRLMGNLAFIADPLSWLNLTVRAGIDDYTDNDKQILAAGSASAPGGQIFENRVHSQILNVDGLATFSKQLTNDLNGTLIIGQNLFQNLGEGLVVETGDLLFADFYNISNTSTYVPSQNISIERSAALYGIAKLDFKESLFLEVTGRNEYSSSFAINKSFFYPSASLAWVFTSLKGLENNKVLSFGKLRFAYANVGNPPSPYSGYTTYNQPLYNDGWLGYGLGSPYNNNGAFTYGDGLGNPNLTPENTASYEGGAELKFFDNRIGLDATYYYSKTTDEILPVQLPNTSGFASELLNAASVENKGVEIVLDVTPVRTKDFVWNALFNWSTNSSKVLRINPPSTRFAIDFAGFGGVENDAIVGKPFGEYYGYDWERNSKGQILINDDPTGTIYPGNSDYGYPLINYDSLTALGDPNPDWLGSINNSFTWKGFTLTALLDIRKGGLIWDGTYGALVTYGRAAATANRDQNFTFPGVLAADAQTTNNIVVQPGQDWYGGNGGGFSDQGQQWLEDGGWVRLRQVGLSYTFSGTNFKKSTRLSGLTLSISGRNLWLSTKYRGGDPETILDGSSSNGTGVEWFNAPGSKSLIFGLSVSL